MLGAVADWATGKSKALKGDIEDLKLDLAEAHEAIAEERKRTQAEVAKLEAYKNSVAQQVENAVRMLCRERMKRLTASKTESNGETGYLICSPEYCSEAMPLSARL